jgi:hypothetical protein
MKRQLTLNRAEDIELSYREGHFMRLPEQYRAREIQEEINRLRTLIEQFIGR